TEPAESALATAVIPVNVRYARLPATVDLCVPTSASFVAMKVAAYRDRAEPRDLFDLARLADRGHVTAEAREAVRRLTSAAPTAREFAYLPARVRDQWHQRLAHQLADPGTADEAIAAVIGALRALEAAREQE
ncbi:MAG TPA: nucleotidyl transferase AbiEii/AbiGii toxin family protein, partial [Euzebya sp.]|nr:nucleotidyl transferase AbiEii/AbiGii toxin family protein [Euzebya sp.]